MSQAELAKRHGVSRKTVTSWKARGYLVVSGGKVDAEASDRALAQRSLGKFRNAPSSVAEGVTEPVTPRAPTPPAAAPSLEQIEHDADAFIRRVLAGDFASIAEAETVKENALAVKNLPR